jgi:hypothetical protein
MTPTVADQASRHATCRLPRPGAHDRFPTLVVESEPTTAALYSHGEHGNRSPQRPWAMSVLQVHEPPSRRRRAGSIPELLALAVAPSRTKPGRLPFDLADAPNRAELAHLDSPASDRRSPFQAHDGSALPAAVDLKPEPAPYRPTMTLHFRAATVTSNAALAARS